MADRPVKHPRNSPSPGGKNGENNENGGSANENGSRRRKRQTRVNIRGALPVSGSELFSSVLPGGNGAPSSAAAASGMGSAGRERVELFSPSSAAARSAFLSSLDQGLGATAQGTSSAVAAPPVPAGLSSGMGGPSRGSLGSGSMRLPPGMSAERFAELQARAFSSENGNGGSSSSSSSAAAQPASARLGILGIAQLLTRPRIAMSTAQAELNRRALAQRGQDDIAEANAFLNSIYVVNPEVENMVYAKDIELQRLAIALKTLGQQTHAAGKAMVIAYQNYRTSYSELAKGRTTEVAVQENLKDFLQKLYIFLVYNEMKELKRTEFNRAGSSKGYLFGTARSTSRGRTAGLFGLGLFSSSIEVNLYQLTKLVDGINTVLRDAANDYDFPIVPGTGAGESATLPRIRIASATGARPPTPGEVQILYNDVERGLLGGSIPSTHLNIAANYASRIGGIRATPTDRYVAALESRTRLGEAGRTQPAEYEDAARVVGSMYRTSALPELVEAARGNVESLATAGRKARAYVGLGPPPSLSSGSGSGAAAASSSSMTAVPGTSRFAGVKNDLTLARNKRNKGALEALISLRQQEELEPDIESMTLQVIRDEITDNEEHVNTIIAAAKRHASQLKENRISKDDVQYSIPRSVPYINLKDENQRNLFMNLVQHYFMNLEGGAFMPKTRKQNKKNSTKKNRKNRNKKNTRKH